MTSIILRENDLHQYMKEIKSIPRLCEEEERELFRKYKEDGCIDSMYKVITSNLRFVVFIAYQYRNYKLPLLDLIQEGNIGLMKAAKKFS